MFSASYAPWSNAAHGQLPMKIFVQYLLRMKIFDKNQELTNNFTLANGGGSQYIHSAPLHWMVAASAGTS